MTDTEEHDDYWEYVGLKAAAVKAALPLDLHTLRRFVQAVMDDDPLYYHVEQATASKFGALTAPPLYPVHAFRRAPGTKDPFDILKENRGDDGSEGGGEAYFGLPPVKSPFKRLLAGGVEAEFFRALRVGETVVAKPRYADVALKHGKSGDFLLVTIETTFTTEAGELLLIYRQTVVWR